MVEFNKAEETLTHALKTSKKTDFMMAFDK